MKETWKIIEDFEDYEISSYGNVRSNKYGVLKPLKPWVDKQGYKKVRLYNNGIGKYKLVHRLVGQMFLDNPEQKPFINHIKGYKHIPKNDEVSNLEWTTKSENERHAYANGMREKSRQLSKERCGINSPSSKISEQAALDIKYGNSTYRQLMNKYHIGKTEIWKIKSNRSWKHLNGNTISKT